MKPSKQTLSAYDCMSKAQGTKLKKALEFISENPGCSGLDLPKYLRPFVRRSEILGLIHWVPVPEGWHLTEDGKYSIQ